MWFCDYNADASRDNDRNTEPHLIEILAHCPSPPICWLLFPYVPLFPDLCSPVHICWQYLQSSIVLFCQDDQAEVSPPDSTLSTYHLPFTSVLYWLPWCFPCASGLCFTLSFSDVSFVWKAPVRKSCSPCCLFWSLGFKFQAATPLLPKLLILLPQLVQLFLFLLSSSLNYIFKLVLSVCVGVGGGVGVWVCISNNFQGKSNRLHKLISKWPFYNSSLGQVPLSLSDTIPSLRLPIKNFLRLPR